MRTGKATDRRRQVTLLLVSVLALGVLLAAVTVGHADAALTPLKKHVNYLESATAAARKVAPHAVVSRLKVAGGFATALVRDPDGPPQAQAGNTAIFKVERNGSMQEIGIGSSFDPFSLLDLGVPLTSQAKLAGSNLRSWVQGISEDCGYAGPGGPGFTGFNASFNPGGWEVDAGTFDGLKQTVTRAINANENASSQVICVDASRKASNLTTSKTTYITTGTLRLYFITSAGTASLHTVRFVIGNGGTTYTLDGRNIGTIGR